MYCAFIPGSFYKQETQKLLSLYYFDPVFSPCITFIAGVFLWILTYIGPTIILYIPIALYLMDRVLYIDNKYGKAHCSH